MAVRRNWRGPEVVARIERNTRAAVARSGIIVQREIKLQLSTSASPSAPGSPPGAVTGTLRRSVQVDVSGLTRPNPSVRVGPGVPYARIHELGGVIVPKRARALAVPIGAAGRAAARSARGSIRSLDLILVRRRGKPPLLARKTGERLQPLFVLLSSVTLPPRPYMVPGLQAARLRVLDQFTPARLLGAGMVP